MRYHDVQAKKRVAEQRARLMRRVELFKNEDGLKQFTLFSKLPPELRVIIWRACLDAEPRRILYGDDWFELLTSSAKWPAIARVCRQSRDECLRQLQGIGSEGHQMGGACFRPERDVYFLTDWLSEWPGWNLPQLKATKPLVVSMSDLMIYRPDGPYLEQLFAAGEFQSLERVYVTIPYHEIRSYVKLPPTRDANAFIDGALASLPSLPPNHRRPVRSLTADNKDIESTHNKVRRVIVDLYEDSHWRILTDQLEIDMLYTGPSAKSHSWCWSHLRNAMKSHWEEKFVQVMSHFKEEWEKSNRPHMAMDSDSTKHLMTLELRPVIEIEVLTSRRG